MPTAQTDGAIKQIVNAFAAVSLGDGISLREADVIDAYGTADEQTAAHEQDELHDWQRIPDDDLENRSSALCFMDDEGLRFHLPAYMRFTLRRYRESESMSADSTLYRLCDPDCIKQLMGFLTRSQIEAIKTFLSTCLEIGDDWLDVSYVPLALRLWQGDERAAGELQAARTASRKRVAGWFGLDPELHERYLSGSITREESQKLIQQWQKAAADKCGPGG